MTRSGIEPRSPGPLVNTLLIKPMTPVKYDFWLKPLTLKPQSFINFSDKESAE